MEPVELSRRIFLGALGAGASLAVSSRRAMAGKGPNDQIVAGCIGVGGQGLYRLNELLKQDDVRIAAICDVDQRHLDRAIGIVEKAKGYKPQGIHDFRKLLENKEIDAVTVVTPDHWHAIPTLTAFEAGKDVFVEKPLSYSVAEGRAMADGSLNYKRVTQMGNHIHNDLPNYRRVVEMVQSGKLGKITRVHAWKTSPTLNTRMNQPPACPPELDYDFWLGPAPKRPYEPLRSHGSFRSLLGLLGRNFHRLLVPHHRRCVLGDGFQGGQEHHFGRRPVLPYRQDRDLGHAGGHSRIPRRPLSCTASGRRR